MAVLVAPLVFRAPRGAGLLDAPVGGGPPASRPRREPLARRVGSKPGQAPPPPTGTADWPSGALHTSGAWLLECGSVCCLKARSGHAATHRHRSQALLARWAGGLKPVAPLFVSTCVGLKPLSPLRASKVRQLKPPSPLRGRNGRVWCSFRTQRCRRFQWPRLGGEQRRHRYQSRHVSASCARSFSRPTLRRSWMQHGARGWLRWGVCTTRSLSRGVSAACRSLMSCNSPRLVAVRYRLTAVWCPKCRPPR